MMHRVGEVSGWELLDSRGRPTVAARVVVDGVAGEALVPSGASTGSAEALEMRDGDASRYGGLGTRNAVANIDGPIRSMLMQRQFADQAQLDQAMMDQDGTANKSRLGANAILAVSIAFARAVATARNVPLFKHFASLANQSPRSPRLTINLFSGGKHAGGQVAIQDCLIVPMQPTIDESLAAAHAIYYAAAKLTSEKYHTRALKADEGGLAPPFDSVEAMFDDAIAAIRAAGFEPGRDVNLAIDVASTHFYRDGRYVINDHALEAAGMIERVKSWISNWPIVSVEDGLAEDDWEHWPALREALGGKCVTLGDDFLCTNPARISRAIHASACDALLLKVNQIGTLTEAATALRLARDAGWQVVVSARSGETEDNWLADLAVGWAGDFIKIGSICQSERLAKYNRLLRIEREHDLTMPE
jgi:enolase